MNKPLKRIVLPALLVSLLAYVAIILFQVNRSDAPPAGPCDAVASQLAHAESMLRDWPALNRYTAANAEVAPVRPGEMRIVFIGDSITDRWDDAEGGFFPSKPYINRGISGQTTQQMLVRFRQDMIRLAPSAVVIQGGTNDIANLKALPTDAILDNISSMSELARAHSIRVVLAAVLPASDAQQRPPEKIAGLNRSLQAYAEENGFIYLDYYSVLADENGMLRAGMSDDGLHPNARGYAVMAPLAEQAIRKALAGE